MFHLAAGLKLNLLSSQFVQINETTCDLHTMNINIK